MAQDVSVTIGSENSSLNAGLNAARKSVDAFKEHTSESFKELGGELAGAFAVGAVLEGVHSLIEGFSKVQDQANRMGEAAEEVQRLGAVAMAAGTDVEALAKSLDKGTRSAVEALQGSSDLASSFATLNLNAEEFSNADHEEKLLLLNEAFHKTGDSALVLDAMFKAFGKSALDLMPLMRKETSELREELENAAVASNETVAKLKEDGEVIEKFWLGFKAAAATAIAFVIEVVDGLRGALGAIGSYLGALPYGFKAAADAAQDFNEKWIKDHEKKAQDKRNPVDAAALEQAGKRVKDEEELGRLKARNAEKEHEALLRSMNLIQKKKQLENEILTIRLTPAKDAIAQEKNLGARLDAEKELDSVNKEMAADKKRTQEEATREQQESVKKFMEQEHKHNEAELRAKIEAQRKLVSAGEKNLSKLQQASKEAPVDELRRIGGGVANANYNTTASKHETALLQLEQQKRSVEIQQRILEALQQQQNQQMPSYDGSFGA